MSQDSSAPTPDDPRLLDLMIRRATSGLVEAEQSEADQFGAEMESELERIELTAAAYDLALLNNAGSDFAMPAALRDRISADAQQFLQEGRPRRDNETHQQAAVSAAQMINDREEPTVAKREPAASKPAAARSQVGPPVTRREVIAMTIAAASLLLVFSGLNPLAFNPTKPTGGGGDGVAVERTNQEKLDTFLANATDDLVDLPFAPIHVPDAGGRVVWSDEKQQGYMVLNGVPVNDPTIEQYQLWIFDTDPAQEIPVDGGVFDIDAASVNADGSVIVPFKSHVPVDKAVQFAITIEKPGGVMRSKRERIPLLAAL
ncbi:MAG: anti-sigma factor [Planctomycetota bacterium]